MTSRHRMTDFLRVNAEHDRNRTLTAEELAVRIKKGLRDSAAYRMRERRKPMIVDEDHDPPSTEE